VPAKLAGGDGAGMRLHLSSIVDMASSPRAHSRIAGLIFMLCRHELHLFDGFGGVCGKTLEVAIYQALRFDFDPVAPWPYRLSRSR